MLTVEIHRHSEASPWTYADLDRRQREIQTAILARGEPGRLLLSEVAPVVTLGTRTGHGDWNATTLAAQGVATQPVDRGGLATYHGPGQWVLFVVERLDRLTGDARGVRQVVDTLLQSAQDLAQAYGQDAVIREAPCTGLWTTRGKLASIGIRVRDRVVQHGIALNVHRTGPSFAGIRACGLDAAPDYLFDSPCPDALFEEAGNAWVSAVLRGFSRLRNQAEDRVDAPMQTDYNDHSRTNVGS